MAITYPKLSQLRLSPLNQRKVKPSAMESMADDIAAHGLIQNLVGGGLSESVTRTAHQFQPKFPTEFQ